MKPLAYTWPYALLFWAVFAWAFFAEFFIVHRARQNQTASDSKSLQVIMFGQAIAFAVAFPMAWARPLQFAPECRTAAFFIGIAMMIAGGLFRRHCWRMLGTSFTGDVKARPDQLVVTRGAYKFLRHPSYTAGLILSVGVGVALGSWASALVLAVVLFAVYRYRMGVEERTLLTVIGEPYRRFMATRKRLIPFVY